MKRSELKRTEFKRKPPKEVDPDKPKKKKKKNKPRQKKPPRDTTVADNCMAYRNQFSSIICEVDTYLKRDPAAKEWLEKAEFAGGDGPRFDIHHIFGRSKSIPEMEYFCSLVHICRAAHSYGHDLNPPHLLIASLGAKIERHRRHKLLQEAGIYEKDTPIRELHWHVPSLDRACGYNSLKGYLEGIILPKMIGTVWEGMTLKLIRAIDNNE